MSQKLKKEALITPLTNLSCCYCELGNFSTQLTLLNEASDIVRNAYGNDHFQLSVILYNLATCYAGIGKFKEMEKVLNESLSITINKFHKNHAKAAKVMLLLAESYEGQQRFQEQIVILEKAAAIVKRHCGSKHPQWGFTLCQLANAYGLGQEFQKEEEAAFLAHQTMRDIYGEANHPDLSNCLRTRAISELNRANYTLSLQFLDEALEYQRKAFGSKDKEQIPTVLLKSKCLRLKGMPDEALSNAKLALDISYNSLTFKPHKLLAKTYAELAYNFDKLEDKAKALEYANYSLDNYSPLYSHADVKIHEMVQIQEFINTIKK